MTLRSLLMMRSTRPARGRPVIVVIMLGNAVRTPNWLKASAGRSLQPLDLKPGSEPVATIRHGRSGLKLSANAGVAVVPLDPKLRASEVTYILNDSEPSRSYRYAPLSPLENILPDLPTVRAIVVTDGGSEPLAHRRPSLLRLRDLRERTWATPGLVCLHPRATGCRLDHLYRHDRHPGAMSPTSTCSDALAVSEPRHRHVQG